MKTKPSLSDIYAFLRKHDALIVHFSGSPKGLGGHHPDYFFPNDLLNVIAGGAHGGISCSLIRPGDNFDFGNAYRNSIGNVGVVLGLQDSQSLINCNFEDAGSMADVNGNRSQQDRDISVMDLENCFLQRSKYNEVVIRNYIPLGIFFGGDPLFICEKGLMKNYDILPDYLRTGESIINCEIEIDDIVEIFSDQNIYTFENKYLKKLENKRLVDTSIGSIYVEQ